MKILIFSQVLFLFLSLPLHGQDDMPAKLLKRGAELEKLADGFQFTEGPSADRNGNVCFTDQPNDRILFWNNKTGLSVFMEPSGRSNGLSFDKNGNLWSCADEKNELWKISPDKKIEKILNTYGGKLLNGPNDLWICPGGGIYFTDPFYKRSWWEHTEMPQEKQCVYYLTPDHKTLIRVEEDLLQPNGIVGTPDGKKLFVADIRGNKTWSYSINADGTLSEKTLFCELGSDGMTIDSGGNIYLTGKGVTVFDRTGKRLGNIAVPENWTANVCFGGRNLKSLYITASRGFYRIRMKIKGTAG
ncbi:MAG: gluconolactonase [Bacteroidetes bacterium RBG_13_43_22]|nr:MAG: gluconolactonase [Bacteroidetes bacterium RBG_13_43_22]